MLNFILPLTLFLATDLPQFTFFKQRKKIMKGLIQRVPFAEGMCHSQRVPFAMARTGKMFLL